MKIHLTFFFVLFLLACKSSARQGDKLNNLLKSKREGKTIDVWESKLVSAVETKVLPQDGLKEKAKVDKLPGQPEVEFTQYAGYVTVDEQAGRALFYYFAEAEGTKRSSKPLLLWLNGGPGCSSFGYGAMAELGPFRVKSDGKTLYKNKYAWNKVANVLFLESPAGVGFSYSNRTSDYELSGDKKTAKDAYVFLVNWLERFPEYKNRDFYIAGESYAGHYVPQLADTILNHNKKAKKTIINLKGITIGNAVINDETDGIGMFDYFWTHALTSDETHEAIHKYCDFSPNATVQNSECNAALALVNYGVADLDIYNIYAPLCASRLTAVPKPVSILRYDPCTDDYIHAYLNLPEVQKALHANVTRLDHPWSGCSVVINGWRDSPSTILPLLQKFMANGIRVWVYSGDIDGRVPVTSTRYSISKLQLPVGTPWQPWYLNEEVGGYSVVYKGNLTLATVRGAGHEVPSYQPIRALALIKYFLKGKPLPTASD